MSEEFKVEIVNPEKSFLVKEVDLVVVRELTSGIYFGEPKGRIKTEKGERAFNTMSYTSGEVKRIAEIAFKLAKQRNQKVCSVDKANVLDVSQLWREETILVSNNFKEIELTHQYVDNAAMQLVRNPSQFRSEERRVEKECRSRWSPYH